MAAKYNSVIQHKVYNVVSEGNKQQSENRTWIPQVDAMYIVCYDTLN